ncbi:MAG: DUF1573 domain-containing protein [Bacteroidales bacterium]|jgi:hypothetical protein|nr:DUF1573 domain-containing protein [Bacteroidales bacterium]
MSFKSKTVFLMMFLAFFACKEDRKRTEVAQIVTEWIGKTVQFPESIQCNILGKDTVSGLCSGTFQKEYKILLYVDSSGCSSCRLKLFQWHQLIEEADSLLEGDLGFLLFFQPKNKKELGFLFQRDKFDHPVFIDMGNTINYLNNFPQHEEYQCFLLDKNDKILMIGNPTLNPKIWELYKQIIIGEVAAKPLVTTVELEQTEIEIKDFRLGKTSEAVFVLKNTGVQPLVIQMVNASCGCAVPEWDKQPIAPGESAEIKISITPEEKGYFNKTITIHCNAEDAPILLKVRGMVKI